MKNFVMFLLTFCFTSTIFAQVEPRHFTLSREVISPSGNWMSIDISDASNPDGIAFDLFLSYDPTVVMADQVTKGAAAGSFFLTYNTDISGKVYISMFSIYGGSGGGRLLNVHFIPVNQSEHFETPVFVTRDDINERQIPSYSNVGYLSYTPLVEVPNLLTSTTLFR